MFALEGHIEVPCGFRSMSGERLDVDVELDVTHPYVWDLVVDIWPASLPASPVTLMDRNCFGSAYENVDVTFSDEAALAVEPSCSTTPPALSSEVQPEGSLVTFDGQAAGQVWSLRIVDSLSSDAGTLNSWCVTIEYELP